MVTVGCENARRTEEYASAFRNQQSLKNEGVSFQSVANSTREELARHYLKSPGISGAEISYLLGYEDPNSFFRAFSSWTDETPDQARTAMLAAN